MNYRFVVNRKSKLTKHPNFRVVQNAFRIPLTRKVIGFAVVFTGRIPRRIWLMREVKEVITAAQLERVYAKAYHSNNPPPQDAVCWQEVAEWLNTHYKIKRG